MTELKLSRLIDRTCPVCQTSYKAKPHRLKWGKDLYCSRACALQNMSTSQQKRVVLTCVNCLKEFQTTPFKAKTKKTCSQPCHFEARRKGLVNVPRPPATGKSVTFACERCGIETTTRRIGARRFRFCSSECANASNTGANNIAWRGGYKGYYGSNWKSQRRAARRRDKYTCQRCGITEEEYGKQLDVHHIIPFNSFLIAEAANNLKNLTSLCHFCHMDVEWNMRKAV